MRSYDVEHNTSSPGYPKSNGKAESAVKIVKSLLEKAEDAKGDFWLWTTRIRPLRVCSPIQQNGCSTGKHEH